MTVTSTRISFGLYVLDIKQDGAPTTTAQLQPFSKLDDLRLGSATIRPYATYEPDFWLLDGQYKFLPSDYTTVHVGLISLEMSDAAGGFTTDPELTITFGSVQSIDSLAIIFSINTGDYADDITVAFYDDVDALIRTDDYTPSDPEFSTGQAVADFKKIVITFHATNKPYRYLRVTDINYGDLLSLEGESIKAAQIVEEIDQLSAELRIGALNMRLHSDDLDFNPLNPAGFYTALKERQPIAAYEIIDGSRLYLGQFYLDTWENTSDTEIEFECIDRLGVLDQMIYKGGIWTGAGVDLEDLIEDILGGISVPYELDGALFGTKIKGWLPVCTYREALQQIGFAVGASVSCARFGAVRIQASKIASSSAIERTITSSEKSASGGGLTLRAPVTGVEVSAHSYVASSNTIELFNDTLAIGDHEILFSQPVYNLGVTGATIAESGVNYAILTVAAAGTVVLSGDEYIDTAKIVSVSTPPATGQVQNVLKITDATLVNQDNASAVAQRVYDYYQQRYLQKFKLFAPFAEPGNVVLVDALFDTQIRGVIEKMDIDLALGMAARVEVVGTENV